MTTEQTHARIPDFHTLLFFAPPVLLGIFIRLYGLSGQILVDDEWHSLNFVLDKSFVEVLTTHGLGANCIPQNILNWILLHTFGWSEIILFLPSILLGVLGILIFPWLITRLTGRTVALYFSWLFAISPCVTFYSRIVRPYSMVLFFGFLALLCLALWIREGRPRLLPGYTLSGFVAIYFHLYAALPILAPLAALFLLAFFRREDIADRPWITTTQLTKAGALMALLLFAFLGPAHWNNPWWMHTLGESRVTTEGLWAFLSLLAGTHLAVSKVAFAGLLLYGLREWIQRDFPVGLIFLSGWAAFFVLISFGTQDGMHAAIQLARYSIVLFPVAILMVSLSLDHLVSRLPLAGSIRWAKPLGLLLIAGLLFGSPLWRTYNRPNNFMHHSAFQDSYAPFDDTVSRLRALTPAPQMPREQVPRSYFDWAGDPSVPGIIEYPMYIGDPLNMHPYYQHFHRKPVAVGYVPEIPFHPLPSGDDFIYQITPVDYVLSRARATGHGDKMQFANMVRLTDVPGMRRTHPGWLLIVHRDILRETLNLREPFNFTPPAGLDAYISAGLGAPVRSDQQIIVWRIP